MKNKYRVGIIGCGEIAQISHIPYLLEAPGFDVKAICDLSPQVVDQLGEKFHINNRYTDFSKMVEQDDLDVVLVTNKNHAPPALAAMAQGKHVFVEKPIALNLKDAKEMVHAARSTNVKLMVGYMKRYDPAYESMQKLLAEMEKIHLIRVHEFAGTYLINREIYDLVKAADLDPELLKNLNREDQKAILADIGEERLDLLDAHDIMIHLCIHDINALHGLYGLPENIVTAQLFDSNFVTAMMQYGNGVHLMWESGNLVTLNDWDEQITFFGASQSIELRFPFPYLKNAASELNIRENGAENGAVRNQVISSYDEAFRREWQHFHSCLEHDMEPRTNPEEALQDLEFAVALTKAAAGI
jgi:predicted dehydrogenase